MARPGVLRIGDTVLRPLRPLSLTVQAYLATATPGFHVQRSARGRGHRRVRRRDLGWQARRAGAGTWNGQAEMGSDAGWRVRKP